MSLAPTQKPEEVIKKYMEEVPVVPDEVYFYVYLHKSVHFSHPGVKRILYFSKYIS